MSEFSDVPNSWAIAHVQGGYNSVRNTEQHSEVFRSSGLPGVTTQAPLDQCH